jgi:hypothetical protein
LIVMLLSTPIITFLLMALLQPRATLGRLYYSTATGRAVALRIVDAGPGRITLAPETGDAEPLRVFVLSHAGAEAKAALGARALSAPVPAAWKGGQGATDLIRNAEGTFWRHAPGQVVPAHFRIRGLTWQLLAAELPMGRRFEP